MSFGQQSNPESCAEAEAADGMDFLRLVFARELREDDKKAALESAELSRAEEPRSGEGGKRNLDLIPLDEVAWHDTTDDCWVAIYDYVYDCTDFLTNHPGGQDVLAEYAGRDATLAFIGTGHSKHAHQLLDRYLIGELPVEERIFRKPGGIPIV